MYLSVAVLSLFVSSCDFMRSLAGRPTSSELQSETNVNDAHKDEASYTMKKRQGRLVVPFAYTHTNSELESTPEHSYYVLVGTYRKKPTMDKMIADVQAAGYEAFLLRYTNGLTSVALLPCDDLGMAIDSYADIKQEKFCPRDACVLIAK